MKLEGIRWGPHVPLEKYCINSESRSIRWSTSDPLSDVKLVRSSYSSGDCWTGRGWGSSHLPLLLYLLPLLLLLLHLLLLLLIHSTTTTDRLPQTRGRQVGQANYGRNLCLTAYPGILLVMGQSIYSHVHFIIRRLFNVSPIHLMKKILQLQTVNRT